VLGHPLHFSKGLLFSSCSLCRSVITADGLEVLPCRRALLPNLDGAFAQLVQFLAQHLLACCNLIQVDGVALLLQFSDG